VTQPADTTISTSVGARYHTATSDTPCPVCGELTVHRVQLLVNGIGLHLPDSWCCTNELNHPPVS
jgi:hypothetical protein